MLNLEKYRQPWPFPRIVYIRISGNPVAITAYEFKFNPDNTLKGIFCKIGQASPAFLSVPTFFESEQEAKESLANTIVRDIFDQQAPM